jgi:hypothetical protein
LVDPAGRNIFRAKQNPSPAFGDGLQNLLVIRLSFQLPTAVVILATTFFRHPAQTGMAARLGVQFKLAMKVLIR